MLLRPALQKFNTFNTFNAFGLASSCPIPAGTHLPDATSPSPDSTGEAPGGEGKYTARAVG
jgi:hypothetical protein